MKINTKELDREIIKEGITLQSHKLTVIKKSTMQNMCATVERQQHGKIIKIDVVLYKRAKIKITW